jgi:putative Mn2+ efflux pump MntP
MDAFSVSLANGLREPIMKRRRRLEIAGIFAFFQALMPLIGWFCVHNLLRYFEAFEPWIPWIALALLAFIGVKMILDGVKGENECCACEKIGFWGLIVQGVATSIDALSVGFTIAEYMWLQAIVGALIIGGVTFFICYAGIWIGMKFGAKLSGKACIFGGVILIAIGLEIFITGLI